MMAANPYDPVTTTESTELADDDWGLSLPPLRYKRATGASRLKSLCFEAKKHPRCLSISLIVVLLIVLLGIIISVASHHSSSGHGREPTGNEPKWVHTKQGLVFYPEPESGTIVVSFTPDKFHSTTEQPIETQLNDLIDPYKALSQADDSYVDCNSTYSPPDKICRIASASFGSECTSTKRYGYLAGQPCIFVHLSLPDDVAIKPITKDSPLWEMQVAAGHGDLHYDSDNVPLTCQGATEEDNKLLVLRTLTAAEPFKYSPASGFPAYVYRPRVASLPFLMPAMMVQVTSVLDNQLVFVECTVWGQLYDFTGKMVSHDLMSGQFAVFIDR